MDRYVIRTVIGINPERTGTDRYNVEYQVFKLVPARNRFGEIADEHVLEETFTSRREARVYVLLHGDLVGSVD